MPTWSVSRFTPASPQIHTSPCFYFMHFFFLSWAQTFSVSLSSVYETRPWEQEPDNVLVRYFRFFSLKKKKVDFLFWWAIHHWHPGLSRLSVTEWQVSFITGACGSCGKRDWNFFFSGRPQCLWAARSLKRGLSKESCVECDCTHCQAKAERMGEHQKGVWGRGGGRGEGFLPGAFRVLELPVPGWAGVQLQHVHVK